MVCASCGRASKAGARFCVGCGGSLAPRCPACGAESEPDGRFCAVCGASVAAGPATAAVARKVVTIVFADLIGSTALHERLDPESVSRIMEGYHAAVRAPIEAHGGTVVQLLGDGVMCAFGVPRVAEDDALRAVRAGVDVQRSFRDFMSEHPELAGRIGLRVAVNTGEVVVSDDYAAGIGDPLNVAARLQQEAKDGDVLLGESTQRLVAERVTLERVGSFALKGRAEPVTAYRVVSLERPAGVAATPFVGRDEELRSITTVYDAAIAKPAARLAVVLGSPGLGKSRLLVEFARRLGARATVIPAQCMALGGATFAPLAEALRTHLQLEAGGDDEALRDALDGVVPGEEAERARIAGGIGALLAGTPASPEETFFVVRRLLAAFATKQPVVLAIDDFQWAEPLLLDFIEHLVQWGAGVPLLVLAAARPELRDRRSSLTIPGGLVSEVVTLGGLDAGAAMRLAANVIGAETLPAAVAGRVLTASEGNPLFLGELVRMLVNDGALRREGERWSLAVDLAELEMPPTIQALLAARIERLRPEERLVLERAAVVGRQFSRAAVTHLLPREAYADLDVRLESLRRSELIEADAGWLVGEPALRFHHGLIRDAAYRRVLRGTRAELHARFAEWLVDRVGESIEYDETVGWHLEQAHQHLRELGPLDAKGCVLGERAARYLAAAGRRALARDDLQPAAGLLGRALACLDAADPARAELALDWCEALLSAGEVGRAAEAVAELGRVSDDSERLRAWHTCFAGELAVLTDPEALHATADAVAAAAAALGKAGDATGEAKAHSVHALALGRLGRIGGCEAALDRALAAARRAGDRRRQNTVLAGAPLAALWGPSPVTRASGRCLDVVRVLRITQGAPAVEAVALSCQAVLETLRGRGEAARRMIASSRHMVEELGITKRVLEADLFAGLIELLEGEAVAAEPWLSKAYDGLREHGLGIDAAQAAALLGRALLAQGRTAEAEALSHESEALAGDDLKAAIAWRGVRAEALAARGEHGGALDFASKAVEIAAATDDLLDHADARCALAVALRAAGRSDEADAEEARAIELWEAKGATLLVERARRVARGVEPARSHGGRTEPARAIARRVRPNRVTAAWDRSIAALAAGDADAASALYSESVEHLHHPTGSHYGSEQTLFTFQRLLRSRDTSFSCEPLATLGESLGLCRWRISGSGTGGGRFDVGAYEGEQIVIGEVDARGLLERTESFAPDRLCDAVASLYARYAELLPDGPERARAQAGARLVAGMAAPLDLQRMTAAVAPAIEYADRRTLGLEYEPGADGVMQSVRALSELAEGFATRIDDILGARSGALAVRCTSSGTARAGGGAFEMPYLLVMVWDADGRFTRIEQLDVHRDAEALARFDELTAEPPPARRVLRRVRPNAATANTVRFEAAVAARDADALASLLADELETVHHPTGTTSGKATVVGDLTSRLQQDLRYRAEPLATLGDALALFRVSISASRASGRDLDVGAWEFEAVVLQEVDAEGRRRRTESFAADRLGDGLARLYERYAEGLPDGPERTRAAALARVVAGMKAYPHPERWGTGLAPDIVFADRRTLGAESERGAEAVLRANRPLLELADDLAYRIDDVLGARSDALLLHTTNTGTLRASGGSFELASLLLLLIGVDGRITRVEQFDSERDAEALARFDELTAAHQRPLRPVRPNAATANAARIDAAIAARDADALSDRIAETFEFIDHQMALTYDRQALLVSYRILLSARGPTQRYEPLASLGDSLALFHATVSASALARGTLDVGAYEQERISLLEVDGRGRTARIEMFADDGLGVAILRLYERAAELLPDGPERALAAATARSFATQLVRLAPDRYAPALAPAVEMIDHRILGTWSARGAEAVLDTLGSLPVLACDIALCIDDVLRLESAALVVRGKARGTDREGGGVFETTPMLSLVVTGADGLLTRIEYFDTDREAEALARFDELADEPPLRPDPARIPPNAAWHARDRHVEAWQAGDWDALRALASPDFRFEDRSKRALLSGDVEMWIENNRFVRSGSVARELIGTAGDRIALERTLWQGEPDGGLVEMEHLRLTEVDAAGRIRASIRFDLEDRSAAFAEAQERFVSGEASAVGGQVPILAFNRALAQHEWKAARACLADDFVCGDHRTLGLGALRAEEWIASLQAVVELAPDWSGEGIRILVWNRHGRVGLSRGFGTVPGGGGSFESVLVTVLVTDCDHIRHVELFDAAEVDRALARFEELCGGCE